MTKFFFALAFALGLAVVGWIGLGFAGTAWLPLVATVAILAAYLLGAYELRQFRATTAGLRAAVDGLASAPASLEDWLAKVPPSLRTAVRLRVEGERGVLPGPALTPYLVGLLVMLGMLGTFLGMVVTFKGAVFALEGSTDLAAIRSALAEPVRGLGLSFGTSVAGVAASAMLGLMAAIGRRERLEVARALDGRIATVLQPFSLVHQRQESFKALQLQARALPQLVDALQSMAQRIETRNAQLDEQLLQRHDRFQREAALAYTELARSVGASLHDSLAAGANAAGDAIRPVVESAMAQVVQESQAMQERLAEVAQKQAEALSQQFSATTGKVSDAWTQALQAMSAELAALRAEEGKRGAAAVERIDALQAAVAQHLASLGAALEAPITRLLHTAAEVPEAAAGVITQLREEMSRAAERDNLALEERTALLERFGTLLQSVNEAAGEQRAATEALVASTTSVLDQAGARFAASLDAQASQAAGTASQVAAGAEQLSQLAEAFGAGMQRFQASSDKMMEGLLRIEASLNQSTARSDEQLAYYVAQAREVIDLSIASQQGIVESLRELQVRQRQALALADGEAG